jgi:hypothetical protein
VTGGTCGPKGLSVVSECGRTRVAPAGQSPAEPAPRPWRALPALPTLITARSPSPAQPSPAQPSPAQPSRQRPASVHPAFPQERRAGEGPGPLLDPGPGRIPRGAGLARLLPVATTWVHGLLSLGRQQTVHPCRWPGVRARGSRSPQPQQPQGPREVEAAGPRVERGDVSAETRPHPVGPSSPPTPTPDNSKKRQPDPRAPRFCGNAAGPAEPRPARPGASGEMQGAGARREVGPRLCWSGVERGS